MREELLLAICAGKGWLSCFNRREYKKAFQEYTEQFGPAYMEAVQEAGGELQALAEKILDGVADGWARQRFWNRASVRAENKLIMVQYLSPMLLGLENESCARLAELLRDGWAARWPKDAYGISGFDAINRSFKNTIMGIELGNRE